ncbi:MAG TPA: hypothetical protein VG795_07850, partial [Acidimicrobiia bacterium]|nr:hypothetical protein [Acidimicrobiia bacterium]
MTRRPAPVDTLRFVEVDTFPPLADIEHGQLFALSLSGTTTAFTHGLHRFAAKFIPQVPAWALDTFGSRRSVDVDADRRATAQQAFHQGRARTHERIDDDASAR